MKLPATNKAFLRLLISIAEHGNEYYGNNITDEEHLAIGGIIADIQNGLGEARELLTKLDLEYDSSNE